MIHTNNPIIKHKAGLLNLESELSNAPKVGIVMDVCRDTLYLHPQLVEIDCIDSPTINKSSRTHNIKHRVDEAIKQAVIAYAIGEPCSLAAPN